MLKLKQLAVSSMLVLAGCSSLTPVYQRPELPVPQQFSVSRNGLVPAAAEYQETGWRHFFADPQVKGFIAEALRNNRDLRMAALKVQEARAQYNVTDADRYPQLNAASDSNYQGGLDGRGSTSKEFEAGVGRCSLYVLLTIFTPPDSQDFALLGSWL